MSLRLEVQLSTRYTVFTFRDPR